MGRGRGSVTQADVEAIVERASKCILRFLQRRGVITLVAAPGDGEVTVVTDETIGDKDPLLARLLAAAGWEPWCPETHRCPPQELGMEQEMAGIFSVLASLGDQEGGRQQGKRLFLNRRPQAGISAHSVRVQIPVLVIRWYSRAMLREAVKALLAALCDLFRSRSVLLAENTLLRQQVILLNRATPHPRLKARDRFTIGAITKLFPSLVAAVPIVRPDTVIRWHRSLWKLIWRRRSRRPVGRPPIDADTRALIRRMWTENPLWGEDVIAAELAKLGHHVSPATTRNSTCVAFINQITDCNPGARNVGEFFEAPPEFVNEGPGCRGRPRPMRGSDR